MSLTAIITGASTGIGRSLALLMASHGYDLGLMARRQNLLEELKTEIQKKYPERKIFIYSADVADTKKIRSSIFDLSKQLGHLDIFIANAGIGYPIPAWKNNWQDVHNILLTNVMGTIDSLEAAKEVMLNQKKGHLVGISSVAGFKGLPTSSAYCASKAALTTYLEGIRLDLKKYHITVTSIHPGYVATPMTAHRKYMPFLLSPEKASLKIYRAIQKKKSRFIFPWPMWFAVKILEFIPNRIYDFLMSVYYKKGAF